MAEDQETPEERRDKRVAYYAALVEAWLGTRMEKDRTLLALSAGGLALLASFLTGGRSVSCGQLVFYGIGAVAFLAAVAAVLVVLTRNSGVLEDAMAGGDGKDTVIEILDGVAMVGFIVGAVATAVLAFTINSNGGTDMSKRKGPQQVTTVGRPGEPLGQSGVGRIRPGGAGEDRGYSDVGTIRPGGPKSTSSPKPSGSKTPPAAPPTQGGAAGAGAGEQPAKATGD